MELITISEISRKMNVSTRTLRYYEQIGLIESSKKDDYAYRTYDEATITRLQQILVLRKLRIPLKQIAMILQSENTAATIDAFQQNLAEVDDEITALSTIREIINSFITRLNESLHQDIKLNLLDDTALLEAADALTVQKILFKEEKTAADLQAANEKLNKLTDRDVRIVYLPPATLASIHIVGEQPETDTGDVLFDFIKSSKLPELYPEFRHYGFNHENGDKHGYERWATIPKDMEVPKPFVKKHFSGGLYAAFMIPMGMFDEWNRLHEWAANHNRYEIVWGVPEYMYGLLEEHLNAWNHYQWSHEKCERDLQLDLLLPIKEKEGQ
ncbi:MAG: effector binding domain-containing protein [Clostridiales bacterium]|jgi:DNA-binding transcriptional MerR regulator|nr:effector binding domain-containing protein [Clostridiales bacterium]